MDLTVHYVSSVNIFFLLCSYRIVIMWGLKDKVVLVTGASSGIGAATAVELASRGCKLSLVARNKDRLAQVAQMCQEAGAAEVFTSSHDLSSMEECDEAVEETAKHFGAVDVLVNNAGIIVNGHDLADISMEDFDTTMQVSGIKLRQI